MTENDVGRAYLFFDCGAPEELVRRGLNAIRDDYPTLAEMGLHVSTDMHRDGDSSVLSSATQGTHFDYRVDAELFGATNEEVANGLADISNQAYQSRLFAEGEQYRGMITYERDGTYVLRE